jgi:UDP-glucuronate 4-epimerase
MRGSKILITGPTGQVATPIAEALAVDNEVWGIARFTNAAAREGLEKAGVRCQTVNLAAGDFDSLPTDFDYVINLAVAKSGHWDKDMAANAESVGLLMAHCRGAKAFLHCSSGAVYDPPGDEPRTESADLGDNHKPLFPTYSISKIAGETVARTMARALGVPTTIARLNVPYGDNGGWPFYQMEMMLAGMPIPVPASIISASRSGAATSGRSSARNRSSRKASRRCAETPPTTPGCVSSSAARRSTGKTGCGGWRPSSTRSWSARNYQ